jgi:hypothetical protein
MSYLDDIIPYYIFYKTQSNSENPPVELSNFIDIFDAYRGMDMRPNNSEFDNVCLQDILKYNEHMRLINILKSNISDVNKIDKIREYPLYTDTTISIKPASMCSGGLMDKWNEEKDLFL